MGMINDHLQTLPPIRPANPVVSGATPADEGWPGGEIVAQCQGCAAGLNAEQVVTYHPGMVTLCPNCAA